MSGVNEWEARRRCFDGVSSSFLGPSITDIFIDKNVCRIVR